MKLMKKRRHICLALLLCSLLFPLAGCGGREGQKDPGKMEEGSSMEEDHFMEEGSSIEEDHSKQENPSETKELVIAAGTAGVDIFSEAEVLFDDKGIRSAARFLGIQYYKGEPVQLWMESLKKEREPAESGQQASAADENGTAVYTNDLFLYRLDGSKELMIEDIPVLDRAADGPASVMFAVGTTPPPDAIRVFDKRWADNESYGRWYLSQDGACYCWWDFAEGNNGEYTFLKIGPAGKIAYTVLLDDYVRVLGMIQRPDGRIFLVIQDKMARVTRVAEMNPDTGAFDGTDVAVDTPGTPGKKWTAAVGFLCGTDEEGNIYLLPSSRGPNIGGVYKLDLSDGGMSMAMSFIGTTYDVGDSTIDMTGNHFREEELRVLADGTVEILWYKKAFVDDRAIQGIREVLRPASVDRSVVTIRAESFSAWTKTQAARFNRSSSDWQVVLEEYASSNAVDLEEFARLTSVQIATGKGPDILCDAFMDSYVPGMLEKGALLELSGPLKESGILAEDYLPFAFDVWRMGDSVYGVTAESGTPMLSTIDSRVLGDAGELDINSLVRSLQAWEEDSVLLGYNSAQENLRRFLQGSEDLWGMVNWEKGVCDFSGDLFEGLLEVSKRYSYDKSRKVPNLERSVTLNSIYTFMSRADLAAAGRTVCTTLYDDGCHGIVTGTRTMMVNAASEAKEGALRFLCFLLGEEAQKSAPAGSIPVRREQLETWVRNQSERILWEVEVTADLSYIDGGEFVKDIRTYTGEDITEERIQEYLAALEDVRALPSRSRPVIDIICEEAEDYFSGGKPAKEVIRVIQSKVGLYLAERQ